MNSNALAALFDPQKTAMAMPRPKPQAKVSANGQDSSAENFTKALKGERKQALQKRSSRHDTRSASPHERETAAKSKPDVHNKKRRLGHTQPGQSAETFSQPGVGDKKADSPKVSKSHKKQNPLQGSEAGAAAFATVENPAAEPVSDVEPIIERKVLDKLTKLLGSKDQVFNSAPVLAFLTGHLERFDPTKIPELVTGSGFISKAMMGPPIDDFFKQPVRIDQLLDMLGADKISDQHLSQLGIDPTAKTTPRDLLSALGLDAQSIQSELQMLKDNMQVEGLSPYMKRAAKIHAQNSGPEQVAETNKQMANATERMRSSQRPIASKLKTSGKPIGHQVSGSTLMTASESQGSKAQVEPVLDQNTTEPKFEKRLATRSDDNVSNRVLYQQAKHQREPVADFSLNSSRLADKTTSMAPMAQARHTDQPVALQDSLLGSSKVIQNAGEDPYALMEKTFEGLDAGARSRLNLDVSIDPSIESATARTPIEPLTNKSINSTAVDQIFNQAMFQPQHHTSIKSDTPTLEQLISKQVAFSQDPIEQAAEFASEQNDSQEFSQDQSWLSENFDFETQGHQRTDQPSRVPNFSGYVEESSGELLGSKVTKPIVDRAVMMVKQGGGSIKIDIGDAEIGKLEVALDVDHDQVGLRILTGSEQVRDALSSEIHRLRDALSQHNLELKDVELGFSKNSSFAQNYSHGGQSEHGFFEQSSVQSKDLGQGTYQAASKFSSEIHKFARPATFAPHQGQIQVLA